MPRRRKSLFGFPTSVMRISAEAPQVVALRMAKLAQGGPAAQVEATRMVGEKIQVAMLAGAMAAFGFAIGRRDGNAPAIARMVSRRVSRNRKRLLGKP